jgi:uncharacterized protein (TIGR02284 family)
MENTRATVEYLNDLIEINNDRINGFERALKELNDTDTDVRYLFTNCISQSHQFKMELATEVQALSSPKDVEQDTSFAGKLHRSWMNLKSALTGHSLKSVLDECEFGEDAIIKAYNEALEEEFLPAYIREMLNAQLSILQSAHNEVKALRDTVQ